MSATMSTTDMMTKMIWEKFKSITAMKKYFILLSAALLSIAACNKVVVEELPVIDNNDIVLTFTSERPQLDVDTRTAWDTETSSIVWAEGDKIRVGYTLDGDWMGQTAVGDAKFYQSTEVAIDESNASAGTFNVPISGSAFTDPEVKGKYVFYALYPASLLSVTTVATAPNVPVTLKANQTPSADSFDGSTDIMVAKTSEMDLEGLPTVPIELVWDRVVAHGYFTLKDLRGIVSGETVTKVTLTAQENATLAGDISVSLEDGSITATDATNEIVVNGASLAFVQEDGKTNLKIWLSALPETLTALTVDLETNKAHYVRSITGISKTLKRNARNVLAINMSTATRTAITEVVWVKKDITAITSSDVFVIVGNNGANYAMSNDNGTSAAPSAVSVTVSDNKLASSPVDNIQWTLTSSTDGYVFYPNGTTETWLYCTSGTGNKVRVGTNSAGNLFTMDNSGYLKNAYSNFLGVYNSSDWRCYSSTTTGNIAGQTFAFFVKTAAGDVKETPTITFSELNTTVEIGETVTNSATIDPEGLEITYSSDDEDVAEVDAATGEVTGVAAGTATITASFAGNDNYEAASESYTITVVDPSAVANDGSLEHPYTASEARALALSGDEGSYYISGIVTKIQNQYDANYGTANFWIDENGQSQTVFEGYKIKYFGDNKWVVGNAQIALNDNVIIYGTLTVYNETTPETSSGYLVSLNGKTKGLTPGALTVTPNNNNKQITVTWGAATGTESAISYAVSCGTQNYNASAAGSYTFTMADYGQYSVSVVASAQDAVSATASASVILSDPSSTTPTLQYTLDGTDATQGSNGYATNSDITQNNVSWVATANTTISPWRFGGKNLTNVDRALYSTTAISSNISSIEVESGSATATVNSLTITVHGSAADAASGNNPIATKTVTSGITSSTVILTKTDETSWAGKFYRIVYNISAGDSNQYVQFKSAKFYGTN